MNTPAKLPPVNPKPRVKTEMIYINESLHTTYFMRDKDGRLYRVIVTTDCRKYIGSHMNQGWNGLRGSQKSYPILEIPSHGYWIGDFVSANMYDSVGSCNPVAKKVVFQIVAKSKHIWCIDTKRYRGQQETKNYRSALEEYKTAWGLSANIS